MQREQLPKHEKTRGWNCVLYDDGHASAARGKAELLPERARLEAHIRAGKIQVVLVIELSRLSLDESMQDYVTWLTLCADHSVKLATLNRILDPAQHSDWMLLLMEGGFSSVEMKVLTARMAEGRREAFLAGKYLGGGCPKPYVYDKVEKKPVIDETLMIESEKIWRLSETMSAKAIAEQLGLPEISVRRAISDSRPLFYQTLRADPETGELIKCEWDPFMTAARAERIRQTRRTRKTNNVRREVAEQLTALGIFLCGYCAKTVKSWNNSKIRLKGTWLDYYACVTKNKKNVCPKSKMFNHETVNKKVVQNIFFTLSDCDKLRAWWIEAEVEKGANNKSPEILSSIKNQELKKHNLISAIADGVIEFSDAKTQVEEIKSSITQLQNKLDETSNTIGESPDFDNISITREEFETLSFTKQREVIKKTVKLGNPLQQLRNHKIQFSTH